MMTEQKLLLFDELPQKVKSAVIKHIANKIVKKFTKMGIYDEAIFPNLNKLAKRKAQNLTYVKDGTLYYYIEPEYIYSE